MGQLVPLHLQAIHAASVAASGEDASDGVAAVAAPTTATRAGARQAASYAYARRREAVAALGPPDDQLRKRVLALGPRPLPAARVAFARKVAPDPIRREAGAVGRRLPVLGPAAAGGVGAKGVVVESFLQAGRVDAVAGLLSRGADAARPVRPRA